MQKLKKLHAINCATKQKKQQWPQVNYCNHIWPIRPWQQNNQYLDVWGLCEESFQKACTGHNSFCWINHGFRKCPSWEQTQTNSAVTWTTKSVILRYMILQQDFVLLTNRSKECFKNLRLHLVQEGLQQTLTMYWTSYWWSTAPGSICW